MVSVLSGLAWCQWDIRPWQTRSPMPAALSRPCLAAWATAPEPRRSIVDRQQEFVLRTIEERDIRFVRLWFTDVLGSLKSVAVAPAELEGAFAEGIGFDGSAIEGLARVSEADMLVKPDPATFTVLPWRGEHQGTGRMFCDILTPDGEPSLSDPRHVLKRTLAKAASHGLTFYTHPEIEFYLFKEEPVPGEEPIPVDKAGYFDHVPGGRPTTSAAPPSRFWSRWASPSSSATTRAARARTRSTCATPTP